MQIIYIHTHNNTYIAFEITICKINDVITCNHDSLGC